MRALGGLANGPMSPSHPQIPALVLARELNGALLWCPPMVPPIQAHPGSHLDRILHQGSTPGRSRLPGQGSEIPSRLRLGQREHETRTDPGPGPSLCSSELEPSEGATSWVEGDRDSSRPLLAANRAGGWGHSSWEDWTGQWIQSPASKLSPNL